MDGRTLKCTGLSSTQKRRRLQDEIDARRVGPHDVVYLGGNGRGFSQCLDFVCQSPIASRPDLFDQYIALGNERLERESVQKLLCIVE